MHDDGVFDARVAANYDTADAYMFDPAVLVPTVDLLAGLADGQPVLEFAIGTGRVALPLSKRGVAVSGIEISKAMVAKLREKPGSDAIEVTIGDMATTRLDQRFGLVYLVFNTIGNLLTQDEQVECFCNAAAHLEPGGKFVIELGVPRLRRLPPGEGFVVFEATPQHMGIDEFDVLNQRLTSHHYWPAAHDVTTFSSPHRYVWPSELDLMARIAGLELTERWADWQRKSFDGESQSHVSVWTKPAS